MIIHYMSASRIKKYLQCPHSYYEQYENGVRGGAIHLTFGTLIHTVFERWFQEDKDLVELYEEEWNKADIVDPEFFRDGYDIVENFRNMTNREESFPMGFELAFAIDIQTGKIYDTSVLDFENNPTGSRAFLKELEEADSPIIFGFIDRIDYNMDKDILRIIDYKTSRMPLTQYEADEDVQLSMYALVADYLFPEYERVRLELHYVRDGVPVITTRTKDELEIYRKWLISVYYKIKQDTTHVAVLNKYCGWCDAKGNCHAYKELINGEADPNFNVEELDYEQMDETLEKVNIHIKVLTGRKKEIEQTFKDKLKESDNSPIDIGGNNQRFVTSNQRMSYSPEAVMRLFPDSIDKILSVNKTEVDKLAKGNLDVIQELENTGNKYYIAPTLRKRKGN